MMLSTKGGLKVDIVQAGIAALIKLLVSYTICCRTCDLHDGLPVSLSHGLVSQSLEEWELLKEVINGIPAVDIRWPVSQCFGQLLTLILVLQYLLAPFINFLHNIHPEVVTITLDCADHSGVQPACTIARKKVAHLPFLIVGELPGNITKIRGATKECAHKRDDVAH